MFGALTAASLVQPISPQTGAPPDASHAYQIQAPNHLPLPRLLKACAKSSDLSYGRQLHALSIKLSYSSDLYVQTALLSFYSSCGLPDHALRLFDRMPHRNVVAWTAAVHASGLPDAALSIFRQMLEAGVTPDSFSFVSILSACAHLGALDTGRVAHACVHKSGMELTAYLGTALVDMYCKCGSVDDAIAVFDSLPRRPRTVQTWNAMLHGLAMNGLGAEAVQLFAEMEGRPNEVTFVALLCGCAHAGLIREGRLYFEAMRRYGIEPTVKHYGCMVDLLGRAGLLDDALEVITHMPVPPNYMVWGALLSACRLHGNICMAERAMEGITTLDEEHQQPVEDTSHCVIMSNMYRGAGLSEKMARTRAMVGKKPKGRSWIEIAGRVSEFGVGGGASHPMWDEIEVMVESMDAKLGGEVRGDNPENPHSEKLALAFGLIRTGMGMGTTIRISKNLRICENCHDLMKSASRAYERDIVVRDCNRFHRFIGGLCSCKDYW